MWIRKALSRRKGLICGKHTIPVVAIAKKEADVCSFVDTQGSFADAHCSFSDEQGPFADTYGSSTVS